MDFKTLFISALAITMVISCSKSKESLTPSTVQSTQGDYQFPTLPSGQNPFDTSGTGSLFDTSVAGDSSSATAINTTTTIPPVSEPVQQCFSSDSGFGLGASFGMDPFGSSSSSACYDPYSSGGFNPWEEGNFYGMGSWTYDMIRQCAQIAIQAAPASTVTDTAEIHTAFVRGKLALIRCFRIILQYQSQYANWNSGIQQGFNYTDGMYYYMLGQVGQGTN